MLLRVSYTIGAGAVAWRNCRIYLEAQAELPYTNNFSRRNILFLDPRKKAAYIDCNIVS